MLHLHTKIKKKRKSSTNVTDICVCIYRKKQTSLPFFKRVNTISISITSKCGQSETCLQVLYYKWKVWSRLIKKKLCGKTQKITKKYFFRNNLPIRVWIYLWENILVWSKTYRFCDFSVTLWLVKEYSYILFWLLWFFATLDSLDRTI